MAIFISYSHKDNEFVNALCRNLVGERINVWMDRWELKPGDSLIESIQDAMINAGAILIVLSKSYVNSTWCKKELNSGLIRELEEKGNLIIPVFYEDCEIPLFLREKMYVDFRTGWDDPYNYLCESLSKFMNVEQERFDTPDFHVDYSSELISHKKTGLIVGLRYNFCEHSEKRRFTILSIVHVFFHDDYSETYTKLSNKDGEHVARIGIAKLLIDFLEKNKLKIELKNAEAHIHEVTVVTGEKESIMDLRFEVRWMGEDTGKTILYWADQSMVGALKSYLAKVRIDDVN